MKLRGVVVIAAFIAIAFARTARADDETGGSMGGGDFSDTSSASSSSSSSSSNDYSTPSSSYDYSGGGGGGGRPAHMPVVVLIGIAVIAGAFVAAIIVGQRVVRRTVILSVGPRANTDVTVLRVALDARARKHVQSELARIAGVADTRTADGRATMLREVALLLRRLRGSWVYGGAVNEPMRPIAATQPVFQRHVDDARAKFRHELVRNEQGAITRADAPAQHPTTDDGPGLMLVSVIVAARHELFTVNGIGDGEELRQALESLSTMIAGELVAVEIVWMPADAEQRLSSLALEAAYPRPALIPIAGALVGKVFCAFCGSPYPAEAICCPNCGGRAKGAAA